MDLDDQMRRYFGTADLGRDKAAAAADIVFPDAADRAAARHWMKLPERLADAATSPPRD